MKPSKYNNIQVALHWLAALMVLFMLFMGTFVMSQIPNSDPSKMAALRGHMIFGGVILFLTLLRLIWRKKARNRLMPQLTTLCWTSLALPHITASIS